MAQTLEQLTTPYTAAEVEAAIYSVLAAKGVKTTGWKPGAVVRTIIAGVAIALSAFSTLQALIAKAGFLELAEGDWLTLVAKYVYGVERDAGAFASGNVELDNSTGNIYVLAVGDLVVLNPSTNKTYRNTVGVTVGANAQNVLVAVQADEIGTGSNANAAAITQLVTSLLGITVTNPAALIGRDPESDAALKERCAEKLGTLSPNGPRDAYSFVAKSATLDDGTSAGVTRVRAIPDGAGDINVYAATPSGTLTGSIGDTSTPLGAVDEAIQTLVAPLAISVAVLSATPVTIAVTYEIWLRDTIGKTTVQVQTEIANALSTYLGSQPIGGHTIPPASGTLYLSAIEAAIADVYGSAYTLKLAVSVPAGDTLIAADEAPVAGTITGTINFVAAGYT